MANKKMRPLTYRQVVRLNRDLRRFRALVRDVPGYGDVTMGTPLGHMLSRAQGLIADVAGDLWSQRTRWDRVVDHLRSERVAWQNRDQWPHQGTVVGWMLNLRAYWWVRERWAALVCRVKGHDWDSYADAENGYEEVTCRRCGDGHSCYMT